MEFMQECSKEMQEYFSKLEEKITFIYEKAKKARETGIDPTDFPEIHPAKDLASRVEALTGPVGVAERIRELNKTMDNEQTAFRIAEEIVNGKFKNEEIGEESIHDRFDSEEKNRIAELATRAALCILTGGITAAPIEGISSVRIRENFDRSQYLAIYFAGPIRSAGGTEAALAVLVGDWVRTLLKLDRYKPLQREVERYVEEVQAYKREVNLQYPSSPDEIRNAALNIPIEITGEPTETVEVSGFRDLKRIETNQLRGGACLVLNDGIIGKAHKLAKIIKKLKIPDWEWIEHAQEKKSNGENDQGEKIPPKDKFIAKVITGRPVFAYPSKKGGFRVRYGRSRNTGFAAVGLNPATMILLDNFLVPGTQFITERPGKGSIVLPVSSIEGPIVRLEDGEVLQINTISEALKYRERIEKFLFVGDCLIAFGEFLENNHILVPSGYCEEWWCEELRRAIQQINPDLNQVAKKLAFPTERLIELIENPFTCYPSENEALNLSNNLQIPIHPKYNYFWSNLSEENIVILRNWLQNEKLVQQKGVIGCKFDPDIKDFLEKLGVPHKISETEIIFTDHATILERLFAIDSTEFTYEAPTLKNLWQGRISSFMIRDRSPYFIGGRMGRPEKAKGREFFHVLFPVGIKGGNRRSVIKAAEAKKINVEIVFRECPNCKKTTFLNKCVSCDMRTIPIQQCSQLNCRTRTENDYCPRCGNITRFYVKRDVPIQKLLSTRLKQLNEPLPKEIKAVKGLMSEKKIPELLEKGILRAKYNLFTYRDGTIRFDATDAPLTHFNPAEVGVSIEKLRELGYTKDYFGKPLHDESQILELKIQDIVIPTEGANFLIKVAKFIDDLLVKVYKQDPFYHISQKEDLLGELVIGLAPHISAGVVGRIVGFTTAKLCYAHPYWHSAKRRNCFPGETEVLTEISGEIKRLKLKNLYERLFKDEIFKNGMFIKKNPKESIKVFSFDLLKGKTVITNIVDVIKTPTTDHLIKINLVLGRNFETTTNHPVLIFEDGRFVEKKALEIKKGDRLVLPRIDVVEEDIEELDLLKIFSSEEFEALWEDLMIRGISEFTKTLVEKRGLKSTADILGINKKALFNFYSEGDSVPLVILLRLLQLEDKTINDIPTCYLGFRRDHTMVKRKIKIDNNFMMLLGYYLAEGFYRRGVDTYQVDLAVKEEDLRQDMLECLRNIFGEGFKSYINEERITVANRVIFHIFKDILKLQPKSKNKKVPYFVFKLPKEKIKPLIMAYFSGDGGVDHARKTVFCSSYSEELLKDFDLLLLRFGIFSSFYQFVRQDIGIEYKLIMRGENIVLYHDEIGFTSVRKRAELHQILTEINAKPQEKYLEHRLLKVRDVEIKKAKEDYVFSLNAEKYHTILVNNYISTHQCDGDEDTIILGLDAVLNFSRSYLPSKKGGMMDAPLVLTSHLNPSEIDDEVYAMEVDNKFGLEFFERTLEYAHPKKVQDIIDIVEKRIGCSRQFEGLFFTHPTSDINAGPKISRYKALKSVREKVHAQLSLAAKTVASDAQDEARRLLHTHFIPDIIGNLRAFATQQFRCIHCNTKYRRIPLANRCLKCGERLLQTVTEGGIVKYLGLSLEIVKKYKLDSYTEQRLLLAQNYVESIFTSDKGRQLKLDKF